MADAVLESLISQLLEWIGPAGRPYQEVIEAWRTSCPRLPVWEEAKDRGLISEGGCGRDVPVVAVTAAGRAWLLGIAEASAASGFSPRRSAP